MKRTLNIGCGDDLYGTDRIDMFKTPTTTVVVNVDKEKLPYEDNTFDSVRAWQILEHLKNLELFADEIHRVLKEDGEAEIITDSATWIFWYVGKKREHNKYLDYYYDVNQFQHSQGDDAHYHLFVESHLKKLFKKFNKVDIDFIVHGRNPLIRLLLKALPYHFGARTIRARLVK